MSKRPTFLVLDGSSYLFRAYHALPPLTSPSGEPSGALYGIINMMRKMLKEYRPDRVLVVFDPKGKTTRHEYYPEYKANREAMPEELATQIAPIHQMMAAMGLPIVVVPGIEADDVIGSYARMGSEAGYRVIISTGDKDMAQLVDEHVGLINTMNNTALDAEGVRAKFGVDPSQIIDYLALIGDKVDHIPGIPKVGPKTAAKWLGQYHGIDNLVTKADEIKGKVGEYLREHLAQLPLSQRLVTIDQHIDVPLDLDSCVMQPQDTAVLHDLCERFGFKRWTSEYQAAAGEARDVTYECVTTRAALTTWLRRLHNATHFALDTETDSLDALRANLVGLSFAVSAGEAAYVPLAHTAIDGDVQLDREWVLQQLKPLLQDHHRLIVGQNIKYDCHVLHRHGVPIMARVRDTMLASYVLSGGQGPHDMDSLAQRYLGIECQTYESVVGPKGKGQLTFDQVSLEKATAYAAEDADITWRLDHYFQQQLQASDGLKSVYNDIDLPLVSVLARMEQLGVLVDAEELGRQNNALSLEIDAIRQSVVDACGCEFNLDSPKQLQEMLYERLQLPILKKTPKGQPSTAEPALQALAVHHPIVQEVLRYRSLTKLRSTYTSRLPENISPDTGRVHTSYQQAVTVTGRLSSSRPNLQNIPIRTGEGRRVRQAFIASEGCCIMAADYSQIELRIMAHLSEDQQLLADFAAGVDIHQATAAQVYGVTTDKVTAAQRRHAKAINFGLIYGMSAFGLAQQIGVARDAAQRMIDAYFTQYPGVREYMEATRSLAKEQGYVQTLFGRRMVVPEINSPQKIRQKAAERAAINAPMQGTAADIIKVAMVRVDAWLRAEGLRTQMIMQVHDELVFEVPAHEQAVMREALPGLMCGVVDLRVPLSVNIDVGENWDEAH